MSTSGITPIAVFDCEKPRKIAASAMISPPSARLRIRATNKPDEDDQHHHGAGLVLVREDAAPIAGMFGLEKVRRLVDRKLRHQKHAEITGDQRDQRHRGHQIAEMPHILRQQQHHRGDAHEDQREGEAARGERRLP